MHESSESFTWWHRDELQVVTVYLVVVLFFGRSFELEAILLALSVLPVAAMWLFRWWKRTARNRPVVEGVLRQLPEHPWDRSRLAMSILSTVIVGALFVHRLSYFIRDQGALVSADTSFATPLDLYWILFLGWYGVVWAAIAVFLVYKWKMKADPVEHRFLEGLVGSMYFYHGLPPKGRVVTFIGGFFLGGLPTVYAVQIDTTDPSGFRTAVLLIIPVAALILLGALFASRWVGTTPSGEV